MPWFATTPGFIDCPKCGGWQIRDLTKRKANGWPIGAINIVDCDHCGGKGELKDPNYKPIASPWASISNKVVASHVEPAMPVWDIDDPAPPSEAGPWATLKPVEPTVGWGNPLPPEEPKVTEGWASYE